MRRAVIEPSFAGWRAAARALLHERVPPADVLWDDGSAESLLIGTVPAWTRSADPAVTLPKRFVAVAERVSAHVDGSRWDLLYRVAYRLSFENRHLLELMIDDDVRRLGAMEKAVQRDVHKMHAFVRFRRVGERFVAWYRPDHHILPMAAPFFVERFRLMQWSILTPEVAAHWDGEELTFGPGVPRSQAPAEDEMEELWRTYYAAVFNPARVNVAKMRADMPSRFWRDLPELRELPRLLASADARVGSMLSAQRAAPTAAPFVPAMGDLEAMREAARACEGCALSGPATQTVFGEGPAGAPVVLVGEQPGDEEDRQGRPFTGPAGELLDRALDAAGLDRRELYVTNAVKHFAFEQRGKTRIHRTPRATEAAACRPWLEAELRLVAPEVVVCLGATAARAILGGRVRVLRDRGRFFPSAQGHAVLPTLHPAAVLRAAPSLRDNYFAMLVSDLAQVAARLQDRTPVMP